MGKAGKKNTPKSILQAKLGKATKSPTPEQEAEPVEGSIRTSTVTSIPSSRSGPRPTGYTGE